MKRGRKMGFPLGWTELKPSEMPSSRRSRTSSVKPYWSMKMTEPKTVTTPLDGKWIVGHEEKREDGVHFTIEISCKDREELGALQSYLVSLRKVPPL